MLSFKRAAVRRLVDSTMWGQLPRCIQMDTRDTARRRWLSASCRSVVAGASAATAAVAAVALVLVLVLVLAPAADGGDGGGVG